MREISIDRECNLKVHAHPQYIFNEIMLEYTK